MITKILEKIKKKDLKRERNFRISQWHCDLQNFLDFIIDYFNIKDIKDSLHDDFFYPNEDKYLEQDSIVLKYVESLLRDIKPFIPLAYELSQDYTINKRFKENNLNFKGFMKMIRNFLELRRTGRKRVFYPFEKPKFEEFKQKYQKILNFYKYIDFFDGKTTGSLVDHGKAIRDFDIQKEQLIKYLLESQSWLRDCSRATIYRFDKDLFLIKESQWDIKQTLENYDFWLKCLKDYEEIKNNK